MHDHITKHEKYMYIKYTGTGHNTKPKMKNIRQNEKRNNVRKTIENRTTININQFITKVKINEAKSISNHSPGSSGTLNDTIK